MTTLTPRDKAILFSRPAQPLPVSVASPALAALTLQVGIGPVERGGDGADMNLRVKTLDGRHTKEAASFKWVASSAPSAVVGAAPATCIQRPFTIRDGTLGSHRKVAPFGVVRPEVIRLAGASIIQRVSR